MDYFIWCLAAYLVGSIPCGVLVARAMGGRDPRSAGSGNIGATNVGRVLGKKAGIITLLGDALKGALPVLLASSFGAHKELPALVGFCAFFGHIFPIYLKFKGGKGIATAAGIFLAISPAMLGSLVVVFGVMIAMFRMVGLASVFAALSLPVIAYLFKAEAPVLWLSAGVAVLAVYKHSSNIKRILAGTEPKLGEKA